MQFSIFFSVRIIFTLLVFHLTSGLANTFSDARCPENIDELLISHVQIKSSRDFYYCFGFLHGRDRAWQMDSAGIYVLPKHNG